jgi:hypothetical protein
VEHDFDKISDRGICLLFTVGGGGGGGRRRRRRRRECVELQLPLLHAEGIFCLRLVLIVVVLAPVELRFTIGTDAGSCVL